MKNDFYKYLDDFKKKVYQSLVDQDAFPQSPDKVRGKWIGIAVLLIMATGFILSRFFSRTNNFGPLLLIIPSSIISIVLAKFMPRKTAWGYSLHRQAKGLKYYLGKGKWREEIAEKHLFMEEMLPLAISLNIVDQLTKDMAELDVKPPRYVHGFNTALLYRQMGSFNSMAAGSISSRPSGNSSWSGSSGFSSGGSSGGGFGGGGGGSW